MFESFSMTHHGAGEPGSERELADGTEGTSGWTRPRLVRLETGTAEHERARIAFDLLRMAGDFPKTDDETDNEGSH